MQLDTNYLKNRFLMASALPRIFCLRLRLAYRQWSLSPDKKSGEPPDQNPDSSSSLCITPFLESGKERIEKTLDALNQQHPNLPYAHLFLAARYSLLSSAKRLRPLLVLATVSSYGVSLEKALQPACAIEMVHTYSLIHDDLPCMDDDDFRRGNPTLHKVYPESHAILTGDYLLTTAFEILANSPGLSDSQKIDLVRTLAKNAGGHGMIGGQVIDMATENKGIDWSLLEMMHHYKTGCLIIASLVSGAIIANAPLSDRLTLEKVGKKIGIAFQIVDDLLDLTGTLQEMGKNCGSDQNKNKTTALSFMSTTECQIKAKELLESALEDLDTLSQPAPLLSSLFLKLVDRTR